MFCNVKVYAFVLVSVLAGASCAPTDSVTANPIYDNPCVKTCRVTHDYRLSCGSDNHHYTTPSFYKCFASCGIKIEKAYDGPCKPSNPSSSVKDSETCMSRCPVTQDYRPFCGSDNETYSTTGMLTCFQTCGINVTEVYRGKCKLPSARENPCVNQCSVTLDWSPFCGSDNNEYPTNSYLNCFESCGIKAAVEFFSYCFAEIRKLNDGPCQKEQLFIQLQPQLPQESS